MLLAADVAEVAPEAVAVVAVVDAASKGLQMGK